MSHRSRPPAWARRVVLATSRLLGTPDLLADSDDVFAQKLERDGFRAARRWYRKQALASIGMLVRGVPASLRRRTGRPRLALLRELDHAARRLTRAPGRSVSFAGVVGLGVAAASFMAQTRAAMLRPDLGLGRDVRLVNWVDSTGRASRAVQLRGDERWLDEPHESAGAPAPFWPVAGVLETPTGLIRAAGQRVRAGFLEALGVTPFLGRDVSADGDVVLSYAIWRTRWDAAPSAIGSAIEVDGERALVVGVAPEGFDGPICCAPPEYWVVAARPGAASPAVLAFAAVRDEEAAAAWLTRAAAEESRGARALFESSRSAPYGGETGIVGRTLSVLFALATVAWLATLLSGANLVLADTLRRAHEVRLRRALGAGPSDTSSHVVAETALLAVLASGVAVVATAVMTRAAPWALPMIGGQSAVEVELGATALGFAIGAALVATVVCSLPAAMTALTISRAPGLDRGPGGTRFAAVGLGVQVAIAAAVLVVTGVFVTSARALDGDFVGYRNGDTAVHLLMSASEAPIDWDAVVRDLEAAAPGSRAALTARLPVYGWRRDTLALPDGTRQWVASESVSETFFDVVGTRLLSGAGPIGTSDVVVSADLLPGITSNPATAIGTTVLLSDSIPLRVVGVVESATWGTGAVRPTIYRAWRGGARTAQLLVRSGASSVSDLLRTLRPQGIALQPFQTLDGLLVRSRLLTVFLTRLATVFGALCLAVALAGVHAHFARWVRARARSLAIRSALGAPRARLGRSVLAAGLRIAVPGAVLGCAAGWVATRFAAALLTDIGVVGPTLLLATALLLLAASLTAMALPIIQAGRADPLTLLRVD